MHDAQNLSWLGYLTAFVAAGGLLGYLRYRLELRRAPADRALVVWQRREIRARIRRENETAAVTGLKVLAERLEADRDYWQARAEKAERRQLEEELRRSEGRGPLLPPGNGKGN